jgi:homospermidine synthase
MKITNLLMLGCGSIQKSLIELIKIDKSNLIDLEWVILCPEEIPEYIYKIKPDLQHLQIYLKEDTMDDILDRLINSSTFVIDLTVDVDSIQIMKICKQKEALYINSSLEQYDNHKKSQDIEKTTLYYQEILLEKEMKKIKKKNSTITHSLGLNPGAISSMAYYGIYEYCKKYNKQKLKLLNKNKFNLVCKDILETIHISEIDNQEVNIKPKKDLMVSSWSAKGLTEEALDYGFISSPERVDGYKKSKLNKYIYYSDKHSMDCLKKSICLDENLQPVLFTGRMIVHFEIISLSYYLGYGKYCPKITYVYQACPIANTSLEFIKQNNYKKPNNYYVFNQKDLKSLDSVDSVGTTLFFKDGRIFWCGSVLSNKQTKKYGFKYSNATQLQVSISILCGIEWMMKHKNEDVMTSEEIPFKYVINRCKKYWGDFVCKEIKIDEINQNSKYFNLNKSSNFNINER